ncbi:hypothetical protein [Sphingomonas paucimobilis]|uniref:hypothetical protein n=1 Tax=Sphingomonas paucimobilis TaxID=13689 RepID=UPI00203BCFE6|nr:hypothetical protein [Sphingomonas paucimobilis]MCM3680241.1 hypothetical protein [Sphingomonas paucimobilis]
METDLFASLRKRDTGVSTSFLPDVAKHPATPEIDGVTRQEPRKSAEKHVGHEKHAENRRGQENRTAELPPRAVTVPGIRERDNDELPAEWRAGMNRLNSMRMPSGTTPDRWHQIVLDAHRFAWGWHVEAVAHGWSIGSLFGLDPKEPYQDDAGMIFSIRGGHVVSMFKDDRDRSIAAIKSEGGYRWYYRRPFDHLPPIWTLNSIGPRR